MPHKRSTSGWWVALTWLLTAVFFGVSYYYGLQGAEHAWLIWFGIFILWLYVAIRETVKYLKHRNQAC